MIYIYQETKSINHILEFLTFDPSTFEDGEDLSDIYKEYIWESYLKDVPKDDAAWIIESLEWAGWEDFLNNIGPHIVTELKYKFTVKENQTVYMEAWIA